MSKLQAVHAVTGEATLLRRFPNGDTVCVIARSDADRIIACGTRQGSLHVHQAGVDWRIFQHEEPITATCIGADNHVIAGDIRGELGCIHLDSGEPLSLPPPKPGCGALCALRAAPKGPVIALWEDGTLGWLEEPSAGFRRFTDGPAPATIAGSTRLERWPGTNVLAYPARDGRLVKVRTHNGALQVVPAHRRAFYTIFP